MSVLKIFYFLGVTAMVPIVLSQTILQSFETFNSIGCYSDSPSARALHHFVGSSSNMTVESCLAQCLVNDGFSVYTLAGLEFSSECYCGNALLNDQQPVSASLCNMPCSGNSSEICGGSNAINVYQNAHTPFTSGPGEILPAFLPFWQLYGCFEDSVTDRQIPNRQNIPVEEMFVEFCLATCQDGGFNVAGLQFGQECYCGNVALPPGIAAPNSTCNLQCTKNANEFCGAANLNLVYFVPLLASGCVFRCPSNIVMQGEPVPLVSSTINNGIVECEYISKFNEGVCEYNAASAALVAELDGADCEEAVSELQVCT